MGGEPHFHRLLAMPWYGPDLERRGWDNEDSTPLTWDLKTISYIKMQNQVVSQGMVKGRSLEVRELFFLSMELVGSPC